MTGDRVAVPGLPVVVRAREVSFSYGPVGVFEGLTLDIVEGATGLEGVNGVGKSTFLRLCLGLMPVASGRLEILGADVSADPYAVRARVGYVPERAGLPAGVPAVEFVARMARLAGVPRRQARDRAVDVLSLLGLREEILRPIGGYSTGQRQRVRIAQALAHEPELLLLDEPTNGLDPTGREDVLALLERLGDEFGVSVVIASHVRSDVERVCREVLRLNGDNVVRRSVMSDDGRARPGEDVVVHVLDPGERLLDHLRAAGLNAALMTAGPAPSLRVTAGDDRALDVLRDALVTSGASLVRLTRIHEDDYDGER